MYFLDFVCIIDLPVAFNAVFTLGLVFTGSY